MGLFTLPKFPVFGETYISGFPNKKQSPVHITVTDVDVQLKFFIGFSKSETITIPAVDIVEIGLNQEIYRSAGKAAAGAIIGGVLTGGIGLLAGAALGGKRRKDNELLFIVNNEGYERVIELKPSKTLPKLFKELQRLFNSVPKQIQEKDSSVDEIQKYFDLKEKGIITSEEFEEKKKQLLGL